MFIPSAHCTNRADLPHLLNRLGLTESFVEVGVWRADYSQVVAERWQGIAIYLVDPWEKLNDYDDIRNRDFDPNDYELVLSRVRTWNIPNVKIIRGTSLQASSQIPDSLSCVYIDANHAYDHVKQDLNLWYPKIKHGGIIAGHDLFSMVHPNVTLAVAEFAGQHGLDVYTIPGDYNAEGALVNAASWYVVKP